MVFLEDGVALWAELAQGAALSSQNQCSGSGSLVCLSLAQSSSELVVCVRSGAQRPARPPALAQPCSPLRLGGARKPERPPLRC